MRRFLLFGRPVLLLTLVAMPMGASALEVVANFDGGGTDTAPVTDVVDAYLGRGGLGWGEGWYKYINNATYTVGTDNTTPLDVGAGNYLDLSMTPAQDTSPGRYGSVCRSYSGIDFTQSHSIDFKYRVNEILPSPLKSLARRLTDINYSTLPTTLKERPAQTAPGSSAAMAAKQTGSTRRKWGTGSCSTATTTTRHLRTRETSIPLLS